VYRWTMQQGCSGEDQRRTPYMCKYRARRYWIRKSLSVSQIHNHLKKRNFQIQTRKPSQKGPERDVFGPAFRILPCYCWRSVQSRWTVRPNKPVVNACDVHMPDISKRRRFSRSVLVPRVSGNPGTTSPHRHVILRAGKLTLRTRVRRNLLGQCGLLKSLDLTVLLTHGRRRAMERAAPPKSAIQSAETAPRS
jgi:hypothetical protein